MVDHYQENGVLTEIDASQDVDVVYYETKKALGKVWTD